jgi:hypothetical protein
VNEFTKWSLIILLAVNALIAIAKVGKPRSPLTPGDAIGVVVVNALIVVAILSFWGRS